MIVNSDIIYKGNIHCHSTNSDGQLSPEKVCKFYKNLNYDFISLTDHFKSDFNFTISDTSNFSDDKFTTITGAELHAGKNSNGDEWHILSVGIPQNFTSPTEDESGPEIATRALKAGAFVAIAHPEWSGLNLNDALSMPLGIHAIEVFNGVCKTFGRENGSYLIDQVMASGRMIGAIATDDAHYYEKDEAGNQLPYLEAIAITFVPDKQSEFMLFLQGKLDLLNSLDNSYKDELLTLEGKLPDKYKGKINLKKGPYLNTEYLGFYLDSPSPVIQSPLIREAINIGFDRQKMMVYLRNNIGFKGDRGFVPKGLAGHLNNQFLEYQPERAVALVKSFEEQTGLKAKISLATDPNYVDLCEYIQRELQKIGISIKIDVMPPSTLKQARSQGKLEMFRSNWIADYPDAENYLSLFNSFIFSPNGPNYTHYKNPTFDRMYRDALSLVSDSLRIAKYKSMDSLALSESPVVPLYYDQVIRFVQKNIKGMEINPINLLVLKNVKKL